MLTNEEQRGFNDYCKGVEFSAVQTEAWKRGWYAAQSDDLSMQDAQDADDLEDFRAEREAEGDSCWWEDEDLPPTWEYQFELWMSRLGCRIHNLYFVRKDPDELPF